MGGKIKVDHTADFMKVKQMQNDFKKNYESIVQEVKVMFNSHLAHLQKDYINQIKHLDELNSKVSANHNTVNEFYEETLHEIGVEKEEVIRERQKLHIETKKFNKMNSLKVEIENSAPLVLKESNGVNTHRNYHTTGQPTMLKKQSTISD